jgi:hypothetical protein
MAPHADRLTMTTTQDILQAALTPTDRLGVSPSGDLMIEACQAHDLVRRFGSPATGASNR